MLLVVMTPSAALAQTSLSLTGQAQLVCSAGIDGQAAASGQAPISLGQLKEFCNDPDGYDVWIDYPASLVGDSLVIDGSSVPLTDEGTVRVSHAGGAGAAIHTLALDAPNAGGAISLTVRMDPVNAGAFSAASP